MASIGVIVHLGREAASEHARELAKWLTREGHEVRMPEEDAVAVGGSTLAVPASRFAEGLDLVVSLGGDGSMLRALDLVGEAEVPLLGVDHGQLGYLTEVKPSNAREAVERFLKGEHQIEERMLISMVLTPDGGGPVIEHLVLNEVVVERSTEVNTIRLAVDLDDDFFTTYTVDGMIVATPTGSTGYAFSARGPIVDPAHRSLLLTPVSPHMLFDRSLVLSPDAAVRLRVDGHRPATVSVDGRRIATVGDGASIECTAARCSAQFVTLGSRPFHRVLKAKFGLYDR
ncbi:MAG: NAD(+)/NADH kinase [Acidimicrobiaceae bacterium]|jgi:NAD+ kinase|nr:NAD(+)/NADH kinase [Acidimicrobiaceae bacterium]MBT5579662.1 NAD(+)/NADH kinase [Acidimicrobiaceae bacterium]MBT5850182.1 NAD(+)/NADH kinase [Acidimicrobiaceae bacterium]